MLLADPAHHAELAAECDRVLRFATAARDPAGGFGHLDRAGRRDRDRPVELWLTCRMTHVFAIGRLLGLPGADELVRHGVAALTGPLRDAAHGGWYAAVRPVQQAKQAYGHAFVVLAAAGAGDRELLADALAVIERHFWSERDGLVVEDWDRTWSTLEPYRGGERQHAHGRGLPGRGRRDRRPGVAAAGAADHRAGGARLRPGGRVDAAGALRHRLAAGARLQPGHPGPPVPAVRGDRGAPAGVVPAGRGAAGGAGRGGAGLAAAGRAGVVRHRRRELGGRFPYTVDFDGTPVVRQRMHWVVAEALGAAARLWQVTGDPAHDDWYARFWAYAQRHLIDREQGSWRHELDPANRPAATVWDGKPDAYHVVQAMLIPRLPAAPSLVTALARGVGHPA